MRPTRYYVEWDATPDPDVDALDLRIENVGEDRDEAIRVAKRIARENNCVVQVIERTNIHDVTPPEDPPGLIWDWDEDWQNTVEVMS